MRDYSEIWVRQYKPGKVIVTSTRCWTVIILNMELCTAIAVAPFVNFRYCTTLDFLCQGGSCAGTMPGSSVQILFSSSKRSINMPGLSFIPR